jgi:hypothetical protein
MRGSGSVHEPPANEQSFALAPIPYEVVVKEQPDKSPTVKITASSK